MGSEAEKESPKQYASLLWNSCYIFLPSLVCSLLDLAAGSLCLRCSSGTTFPHLFSCSVRLQGSRPTFEAPFSFVSLQCTPVINFVLLLFVPVNRSPLCWASSPRSTRLEVFSFVRVDRCLIEWWMSLYYSVIELPAFWLVCRDAPLLIRHCGGLRGWQAGPTLHLSNRISPLLGLWMGRGLWGRKVIINYANSASLWQ